AHDRARGAARLEPGREVYVAGGLPDDVRQAPPIARDRQRRAPEELAHVESEVEGKGAGRIRSRPDRRPVRLRRLRDAQLRGGEARCGDDGGAHDSTKPPCDPSLRHWYRLGRVESIRVTPK